MTSLTPRQRLVLVFLLSYKAAAGYPPTVREIQKRFSFRSQTAAVNHLKALEKKGYIRRLPGSPRAITILLKNSSHETTTH